VARVAVPVTRVSRLTPIALSAGVSDPANDHSMVNNGATIVLVTNAGGAIHNVQAVVEQTVDGEAVDPVDYAIPANSTVPLGPYPRQIYGDLLLLNIDHADLSLRAFSLV